MGNFYVNVSLKGPKQNEIAGYLQTRGCDAFISPTIDGVTTICEAKCDGQNEDCIKPFTMDLSKHFACPALAVLNHGDDILMYWFYENGVLGHDYNSDPEYFEENGDDDFDDDIDDDDEEAPTPAGGDAQALCRGFGNPGDVAAVNQALRQTFLDNPDFDFEFERHAALLRALGLPEHAVCCGWKYIERGRFPEGLGKRDFARV